MKIETVIFDAPITIFFGSVVGKVLYIIWQYAIWIVTRADNSIFEKAYWLSVSFIESLIFIALFVGILEIVFSNQEKAKKENSSEVNLI